jgi:Ca2+-binding EF-hand superfamily protein
MNLHGCSTPKRLHFEILSLFTMFLDSDEDIKAIRSTFLFLDQNNEGDISREELKDAFTALNEKDWSCECSKNGPSDY